jgi:DNA-binding NtrC family response regulator
MAYSDPRMASEIEIEATARVAPFRGLRILSVELMVVDGDSRGLRIAVNDGVARVGSGAGNDLRLSDPTVSGVHCEIHVSERSIVIKDYGSTNGTWVEGVRINDGEVRPGAVVRVGNSAFRIDSGNAPAFVAVSERTSFGELVGASLEMRRVYAILERIAETSSTILVEGETGTGKDVVARSIHAASARAHGPYVPVDCGAIPESLIETELFGHVRGAFSGAVGERKGVFEEAYGGTLFLDEIGEMPLSIQSKLLRAIETRSIRRVGSNTERHVDVRLIAATNRWLAECVNNGSFREDLYYRLAVVDVKLPPLRSRREDIPILAQHFYRMLEGPDATIPESFLAFLSSKSWPGNIRELRNFIERSVSLGFVDEASTPHRSKDTPTDAAAAGPVVPLHLPLKDARQAWTESFESVYVRSMLKKTGGNLTRAAELAGVNRRFMQRLVARLGIRASEVVAEPEDPADEESASSDRKNAPLDVYSLPEARVPPRRRPKTPPS